MYEHRVIEIPKEAQRRSEDGRRNLTTFLEEKFNEYSKLGWEFVGMHFVFTEEPSGGCLWSLVAGRTPSTAQVMVFRKPVDEGSTVE